jgi:uncharacterized SAM-binding protein YcdF (DUF218 family)
MSSFASTSQADAIVVCCSYDLRVCDYACELVRSGLSDRLVISGNTGDWTRHLWKRPEAHIFAERAISCRLPESAVLIEDRATNFGENVIYSRALIPNAASVVFVTKPAAVLRLKLTVQAQWPEIEGHISSPSLKFLEDVSNVIGILGVIHEMCGDVQRIQKYPELGYQARHELPRNIVAAWHELVEAGFTHHLQPERSDQSPRLQ